MPQLHVLRIWRQVYIIDLLLNDSTGVHLRLHYSHSWIVLIVPWEPLSLLVVSLIYVNVLHYSQVIRWFSIMFEFNTFICMLEFRDWWGRDGAQDPGFCLIESRLHGVMSYTWLYTFSLWMDCCDHIVGPYSWSFLFGWWQPYCGSIHMIPSIQMDTSIPWIHILFNTYSCIIRHDY